MTDPSHPTTSPRGWFKASFSSNAASCVEVRFIGDLVQIRDSKYHRNPTNPPENQPIISVKSGEWAEFLDKMTGRTGTDNRNAIEAENTSTGNIVLRATRTGTALTFTATEWRAFLNGARAHEFDCPRLPTSVLASERGRQRNGK